MAERLLNPRTYTIVFGILVSLTFLTVGVSFLPLSPTAHTVCGLLIAVTKASLVVLFFMHALASPRVTWIVIAAALFWLFVIQIPLTFSDYLTREWLPYLPGH